MNPRIITSIACTCLLLFFSCKKSKSTFDATQKEQYIDSIIDVSFAKARKQSVVSLQLANKADSLSKHFALPKQRARSLRSKAYNYLLANTPEKALFALEKSEIIEKEIPNFVGLIATYNLKAVILKRYQLYDDALSEYQKAEQLNDSTILPKQKVSLYNNIANVHNKLASYDLAQKYYQKALEEVLIMKDTTRLMITKTNLGNTYSLTDNFNAAKTNYLEALAIGKQQNNIPQLAKIYNNLGALYFEVNQDKKALECYKKSIQLKIQLKDSFLLAKGYHNIAELYLEKPVYKQLANSYLRNAEIIFKRLEDSESLAKVTVSKAKQYELQQNTLKAIQLLTTAETALSTSDNLTLKRQIHKKLARLYQQNNNFKLANRHYTKYEVLNDSIFNEEKLWEIANIEKQHQLKIKQSEIIVLEKDKALAEAQTIQKQQENEKLYYFSGTSILIVLLLSVLVMYLIRLRKASKALAKQKELVFTEQIENLVNQQEIQIMNATLAGREREKKALTKELHDNIGSLLSATKFHLNAFDTTIISSDTTTTKLYDKVQQIIDAIASEIRAISHRFDDNPLPDFNLKNAIEEFCNKLENKYLKIITSIHGLGDFKNSKMSIFIFRILQELINNTLKHAEASKVTIYLTHRQNTINIMVEDNGKGFSKDARKNGIGLKNLQQQIVSLQGSMQIDAVPQHGTTISIDIPTKTL